MSWKDVPSQLRHCVVAVYGKSTGGGADGVVKAFKICRDTLAKHGYLYPRGRSQILESIQLTGKGYIKSLEHAREGFSGAGKDLEFERLFKLIEPRLWEYDGPAGKLEPKDPPSADDTAATGGTIVGQDGTNVIADSRGLDLPAVGDQIHQSYGKKEK